MNSYDRVVTLSNQGLTIPEITAETGLSYNYAAKIRSLAYEKGDMQRPRGHNRLIKLMNANAVKRGSMTLVVRDLDDNAIDYCLSRLGRRNTLSSVIAEIINEAARNSGHGETVCDERSGGNSRGR